MNLLYLIDILGTLVFAISGVLAAVEHKFDIVGAFMLGLVTAIGGGTLRDILIGATPVGWMTDLNYLACVILSIMLCYFLKASLKKMRKGLFLFDTIGIGIFTILGIQKTLAYELSPVIALLMGIVSAVFGGVIRDVLSNEVPLIFRKEVYASVCFLGGLLYLSLHYLGCNYELSIILPILLVVIIRVIAVKNDWQIPFRPLQN